MKNPHDQMLQEQLTTLCQTLTMPSSRLRWFWMSLTVGLLCLIAGLLIKSFPMLAQLFVAYWVRL